MLVEKIETIFFVILTAYTAAGDVFHSKWDMPMQNAEECAYYVQHVVPDEPLPFWKDEMGNNTISYNEQTHIVDFWAHSCKEFYFDVDKDQWFEIINNEI